MLETTTSSMQRKFMREVLAHNGAAAVPDATAAVRASDLHQLPEPAQRYLAFMGVVGRPRDTSFRAHHRGTFRLKPGPFMACEAWQYNNRTDVSRIFHMRMRFGGLVPMLARDTYTNGRGRMLGKIADLVTVVDGQGPELDLGELVTYLNDAILYAPSLILGPETRFGAVDDSTFDVTFTDRGRSVSALVSVAADGAPTDFSTIDCYYQSDFKSPMRQMRWSTPVESMHALPDGRHVSRRARAVWHLPSGPFCYAEFQLDLAALAFNVPPGQ